MNSSLTNYYKEHIMNLTRLSRTGPATYFVGVFLLALMTTLGCNHQEQSPQMSRPESWIRLTL